MLRRSLLLGGLVLGVIALVFWLRSSEPEDTALEDADASVQPGAEPGLRATGRGGAATEAERPGGAPGPVAITSWPVGEAPAQSEGQGRVRIRLVDWRGAPLPNHPIEVNWWRAFNTSGENGGRTDSEGRFRTGGDEVWHIDSVSIPSAEGTSALYHSGPFVADPAYPHEVRVVVPGTGRIRGRLLSSQGEPWANFAVACDPLLSRSLAPHDNVLHFEGTMGHSDAEGRFDIPVVLGRHIVSIPRAGLRLRSLARVHLTPTRPVVDVLLRTVQPIDGRTVRVTLTGSVTEGIGVNAYTDAPVHGADPEGDGVTYIRQRTHVRSVRRPDGTYELRGVRGDPWRVSVTVPRTPQSLFLSEDLPVGASALTLEIPEAPADRGVRETLVVARRPDGSTFAPVVRRMRSSDLGELGGPHDLPRTPDGTRVTFRMGGKPLYLLIDEREYALQGIGPLSASNAPERVEVELGPSQPAQVKVVDASGSPVPTVMTLRPAWSFFRPIVRGAVGPPPVRSGFMNHTLRGHRTGTGESGAAWFAQLGAHEWQVWAQPSTKRRASARGVVRGGATLQLVLGDGFAEEERVSGTVIDLVTGAALPDVEVTAQTVEGEPIFAHADARTSAEGVFTLYGLPPSRVRLRAYVRGRAFPRLAEVDLARTKGPLRLELLPARRLSVLVTDAAGTPIHQARVRATWTDGVPITLQGQYGRIGPEEGETDLGGREDLVGLPAARIVLLVAVGEDAWDQASRHDVDLSRPATELLTLRHAR